MSNPFKKPKVQKPPAVIPLPDEEMIKQSKKKQTAMSAAARGGRESTIFTDYASDTLG